MVHCRWKVKLSYQGLGILICQLLVIIEVTLNPVQGFEQHALNTDWKKKLIEKKSNKASSVVDGIISLEGFEEENEGKFHIMADGWENFNDMSQNEFYGGELTVKKFKAFRTLEKKIMRTEEKILFHEELKKFDITLYKESYCSNSSSSLANGYLRNELEINANMNEDEFNQSLMEADESSSSTLIKTL
ncbi:hypothetical protein WICMUC_000444 [Wickerhamomyces mucosus]|uniref:Uncharacterized protein n=1 Tax=Wickerhamomyces mucosus TaxID=1378264 RepID=A0A9P8PXH6_9ASCO|nr:hypothetical protein WICMUC_000444 [Wickerhamomyces mucosus]